MSQNRSMRFRLSGWNRSKRTEWLVMLSLVAGCWTARAQETVADQVKQLTEAMNRVQAQLDASQRQLQDLRQQLETLQGAADPPSQTGESDAAKLAAQVDELREHQAVMESQIAVQEQTKVESESKFPVKVSGLVLLMNGFVNTRVTWIWRRRRRSLFLEGGARGHRCGRQSWVSTCADRTCSAPGATATFVWTSTETLTGTGAYGAGYGVGLVRLRTAHADLDWGHTEAFFPLDRPIVSPNAPEFC